jgi:putative SOS response-associated peptidase YedK
LLESLSPKMIISFQIPDSIGEHAALAQAKKIRHPVVPSVMQSYDPQPVSQGEAAPLLVPRSNHAFELMRWGSLDQRTRQTIYFVDVHGKNFARRGVLFATSFEAYTKKSDGSLWIARFSTKNGVMNIGFIWQDKNPRPGLSSCALMLCKASAQVSAYLNDQPVVVPDEACNDFLNPQKSMHGLWGEFPAVEVTYLKQVADVEDPDLDPLALFAKDPRYVQAREKGRWVGP